MNQVDFLVSLEAERQFRGRPFSRAELQSFVAAAWWLIDDNPDPAFWCAEFLAGDREPAEV
jgi:hypothetical protein